MSLLPAFFLVQIAKVPLPPPFLRALRKVVVDCTLDQATSIEMVFDLSRTLTGELDLQIVDLFRPLMPVSVRLAVGLPVPQALANGYVRSTRVTHGGAPGTAQLTVTALDATGTLMNHVEQPMLYPNLPDSAVAALVFGRYGMVPLVAPTPPTRTLLDTITTQRGTDILFLRDLARQHAYDCYVQPEPLTGLDTGHFHPPLVTAPPQAVLSIDQGAATNLDSLDVHYDALQPTTALSLALDLFLRAPVPAPAVAPLELPLGLEPAFARVLPPAIRRPRAGHAANPAEVLRRNLSVVTRASRAIRAEGGADGLRLGRVLRPRLPIAIRGPGRQHSGHCFVTQVRHEIATEGYRTSFTAWRNAVGLTGAELFIDPLAALA